MKNWRPFLLAALAALALQACEVQVNSGSTKVQEPRASLPEGTQLTVPANTTAAAPPPAQPVAPADASAAAQAAVADVAVVVPAPAPAPAPEATAIAQAPAAIASAALPALEPTVQAPAQPDMGTLGAPAAVPDAIPAAPAGNAATTELARFFEANAPGTARTAHDKKTAAQAGAAGKARREKQSR